MLLYSLFSFILSNRRRESKEQEEVKGKLERLNVQYAYLIIFCTFILIHATFFTSLFVSCLCHLLYR